MSETEPEFKPVEVEVTEIGKQVIKFVFMTEEELAFWWIDNELRYGAEALGKDF